MNVVVMLIIATFVAITFIIPGQNLEDYEQLDCG